MSKVLPKCGEWSKRSQHAPGVKKVENEQKKGGYRRHAGFAESLDIPGRMDEFRKIQLRRLCSVQDGKRSPQLEEYAGVERSKMLLDSLRIEPDNMKGESADPRLIELEPLNNLDREMVNRICLRSSGTRIYLNPESPEHDNDDPLYYHFARDKLVNHAFLSMYLEKASSLCSRTTPEAAPAFLLCIKKARSAPVSVTGGVFEESLSAWDFYVVEPFTKEVEVSGAAVSVVEIIET